MVFFTVLGAIQLRRVIRSEGRLILSGILSILFGTFLLFYPGASRLGLILLIGAHAIAFEIMEINMAFLLRGAGGDMRLPSLSVGETPGEREATGRKRYRSEQALENGFGCAHCDRNRSST